MRRLWLVCTLVAVGTAAAAFPALAAPTWMDVATVSATLGNMADKVCVGGGRTDVGCPSYAPSVDATGGLHIPGNLYVSGSQQIEGVSFANGGISATGVVTATTFYGSGAGLTNLPGSAIKVTDGVSGSIIYRDNVGNLTATNTLAISMPTGYVGIGTTNPSSSLHIVGVSDVNTSGITLGTATSKNAFIYPMSAGSLAIEANGGGLFFRNSGGAYVGSISMRGMFVGGGGAVPPSQTLHINGSALTVSWTGINFSHYANVTPTAPLEVSGTISATMLALTQPPGQFVNALTLNRSGFGTAGLIVGGNTPAIMLGWSSAGGPVTGVPGLISIVSSSGNVGVNTSTPSRTFHVSGSALTTSWTGINFSSINNVTPTAPLEVSGTISATRYVGDGSGLTGVVAASGDRIASGTTYMVADGSTGYISLTQATGNTGWFDPYRGLVTLGVSSTGTISGTRGYFSGNVGIGIPTPNVSLDVSGTISATAISIDPTGGQGGYIFKPSAGRMAFQVSGNTSFEARVGGMFMSNASIMDAFNHPYLYFPYTGTSATNWFSILNANTGYAPTFKVSGTDTDIGMLLQTKGNSGVGINIVNSATTALEVSGTISATNIKTSNTVYATHFVGDGSGLTGVVAASGDRIASGTTYMVADGSTGYISLTQATGNTGWFDPYRGLVTLGVSSTGTISGTSGYFSGNVGIGTAYPSDSLHVLNGMRVGGTITLTNKGLIGQGLAANDVRLNANANIQLQPQNIGVAIGVATPLFTPSATLHVSGTTIINSWTSIGFGAISTSRVPTAPLEVAGTISATALTLNGVAVNAGFSTFASLTDVSYSAIGSNVFGPGSLTGANTNVTNSTAFGVSALSSAGNTGFANTAIGASALWKNTTGNWNVALGRSALTANTSGNQNTALGTSALPSNTIGFTNTAVGFYSMYNNTGGNQNNAFGSLSGFNVTNGNYNTLLGYAAGYGITTGSSNTVIGSGASPYSATGSNQLSIANAIYGDVGNGSTLQAKVGINVTSPTRALEVSGTISATNIQTSGTVYAGQFVGDGSGLTGVVAASGDRIASGTTYMVADGTTGYISLTQATGNTGWFDPYTGLATLGVSATGGISGSTLYSTGSAGIGTAPTGSYRLSVVGTSAFSGNAFFSGSNIYLASNNKSLIWGSNGVSTTITGAGNSSNDYLAFATAATEAMRIVSTGYVGIGTSAPSATLHLLQSYGDVLRFSDSSGNYLRFIRSGAITYVRPNSTSGSTIYQDPSGNRVFGIYPNYNNQILMVGTHGSTIGTPSATVHISGTLLVTSWTGVNFSDANNVTPTAPLEVSGTISATRFVGDGSGLTGVVAASGDRIASGTTYMVADGTTGYISLTQATGNTGWFDPYRGLVTLGVSATGTVSATAGYFSGNVGIGIAPQVGYSLYTAAGIRAAGNVQAGNGSLSGPSFSFYNSNQTGMYMPVTGYIGLVASGTEAMRIVSTGYVAIGTSTPYANLHVVRGGSPISPTAGLGQALILQNSGNSTAGTGVSILSGNAGNGRVNFGDTDLDNVGSIAYYHSDDSMRFTISNSEAVRFVSNGYVGIGTANPSSTLHILGSNGNVSGGLIIGGTSGYAQRLALYPVGTGSAAIQVINGSAGLYIKSNTGNNIALFDTNTNGFMVGSSSSGNLSATLHVLGNTLTTSWTYLNANPAIRATPTTPLEVSGTISATRYVGDGSGLTGVVAASGDRIASGTTYMVADGTTGYISLTQATGNTGWFDPYRGLITLGVSSTGTISATNGYISGKLGVGISATQPLEVNGTVSATTFAVMGPSQMQFSARVPGSVNYGYMGVDTNGFWQISGTGGVLRGSNGPALTWSSGRIFVGSNYIAPMSATLHVGGNALITSWTGINLSNGLNVTPTAPLEVSGTISATALYLNGVAVQAGTSTFASLTDVSYSAAGFNIFGPGSTAGANANVTYTTAFGYGALGSAANSGPANTAFGATAMANNTSGGWNVAIGRSALKYNTSGGNNTAVGTSAMVTNTTGGNNVAVGYYALASNTTGTGNTAVGTNALLNTTTADSNAAFGNSAGKSFTGSSYNNTVIGNFAAQLLTTGSSNTIIGYNTGSGMTSGNNNIVIGANVSPYNSTASNQLAIANAIYGDIGNGDALRAKIGINVTSPTVNFAVSGTSTFNNGYVGITTSSPKTNLDVGGPIRIGGEGSYIGLNLYYDTAASTWRNSWASQQSAFIRLGQGSAYAGGDIQFGTTAGSVVPVGTDTAIGSPVTQFVIRNLGDIRISSWTAIGFNNVTTTPTTPLTVSGTVSATALNLGTDASLGTCTTTLNGTLKVQGGAIYLCRP